MTCAHPAPERPRIQLSDERGWRIPAGYAKCDRTTRFGNPFSVTKSGHLNVVATYFEKDEAPKTLSRVFIGWLAATRFATLQHRRWLLSPDQAEFRNAVRKRFAGRGVACWCVTHQPCHGDTLAEVARTPLEHIALGDRPDLFATY